MEIPIHKTEPLKEGKHYGKIAELKYREIEYKGEKLHYCDVFIEIENGRTVKYSCDCTKVTDKNKLGKLLLEFGATLTTGQSIDPEKVLLGKSCELITMNNNLGFPDIVKGSLRSVK